MGARVCACLRVCSSSCSTHDKKLFIIWCFQRNFTNQINASQTIIGAHKNINHKINDHTELACCTWRLYTTCVCTLCDGPHWWWMCRWIIIVLYIKCTSSTQQMPFFLVFLIKNKEDEVEENNVHTNNQYRIHFETHNDFYL